MITSNWIERARALESRIAEAGPAKRLELQPELTKVLNRMEADGVVIPRRLRDLDAILTEEAIEARFDNMPV